MRYEMTARENIAVGRVEDIDRTDLILAAAEKSLADQVVRKLPLNYEQMLGRRFEGGVDLSGGEWQKVALARAYLRNAEVLILDEPTAALDARSEFEVFERFAELTLGKMALFISHRFSTVRMADRIIVLENGKIVEEGNHDQLTRRGGRYAEMFEMQAAIIVRNSGFMPKNTHLEVVKEEAERHFDSSTEIVQDLEAIRKHALETAPNLPWLPNTPSSSLFEDRFQAAVAKMQTLIQGLSHPPEHNEVSDDFRWLHDNVRFLHTGVQDVAEGVDYLRIIPHVRTPTRTVSPRPGYCGKVSRSC